MKNYIWLLLLLAVVSYSWSQPVITNASIPQIGESYTFNNADTLGITSGTGGASKTWNYNSLMLLNDDNSKYTNHVVNPSAGYQHDMFANAQYAYQSNGGYSYFRMNGNNLERMGTGYEAGYENLSNTAVMMTFPYTYGDTQSDNFEGMVSTTYEGMPVMLYRKGNVTTEADGYGTLVLPSGTYPNVLRTKMHQVMTDSLPPIVMGMPPTYFITETDTYIWQNNEYKYGLFSISNVKNTRVLLGDSMTTYSKSVYMNILDTNGFTLTQPMITSPVNGTINLQIPFNLQWSASKLMDENNQEQELQGDIKYMVEVSSDINFIDSNMTMKFMAINQTMVSVNSFLPTKMYYARVKAIYEDIESDWSALSTFAVLSVQAYVTKPVFTYPASGQTNVSLPFTMRWNTSSVIDADSSDIDINGNISYMVQLSSDMNFADDTTMTMDYTVVGKDSLMIDNQFLEDTLYARIKSMYLGMESQWSDMITFFISDTSEMILTVPMIKSPLNGSTDVETPLKVTWRGSALLNSDSTLAEITGDINYTLQISSEENFTNTGIIKEYPVESDSTITVDDTFMSGQLYARIKAGCKGIETTWSSTASFNLMLTSADSPDLIMPEDDAEDIQYDSVKFTWNTESSLRYTFRLRSAETSFDYYVSTADSFVVYNLNPKTEYFWSVQSMNAVGDTSEWSQERSFMTSTTVSVKEEIVLNNNIKVQPNPATESANIWFNLAMDDYTVLNIYNLEGKLIHIQNLGYLSTGEHTVDINVNDFGTGSYIITIKGLHNYLTKNIIVNYKQR